ncbi:MAG TPA: hypothetical protein PKN66_09510 [Thermodesulfovibrio thiophilus]|nr:hypothetical protein [Thermodesulfovibrio thiophilus]
MTAFERRVKKLREEYFKKLEAKERADKEQLEQKVTEEPEKKETVNKRTSKKNK